MDNITINQTDKTNNNPKKRIEKDKLGTVSIDTYFMEFKLPVLLKILI